MSRRTITIEYGNILILSIVLIPSLKPKRPGMLGPHLQTTLRIKGWRLRFAATISVDDTQAQRIRYWGCWDPIYRWPSSLNDQGLGMGWHKSSKDKRVTGNCVTSSTDVNRAQKPRDWGWCDPLCRWHGPIRRALNQPTFVRNGQLVSQCIYHLQPATGLLKREDGYGAAVSSRFLMCNPPALTLLRCALFTRFINILFYVW